MRVSTAEIIACVAALAGFKYAWRVNKRARAIQTSHAEFAQNRAHWMHVQTTRSELALWEISTRKAVSINQFGNSREAIQKSK